MPLGIAGQDRQCQARRGMCLKSGLFAALLAVLCFGALSAPAAGASPPRISPSPDGPTAIPRVDVQRYDIWVAFRPERGWLRASATLTLRAEKPVDVVELRLSPQLHISRIVDSAGRELAFARSGRLGSSHLLVTLLTVTTGEFTVRVSYSGVLAGDTLDYIAPDGILLRDESEWYPTTDFATFAQHRIRIAVPAGWTAAAGGSRTVTEIRDRVIYGFTTSEPIYSRAIAATPQKVEAFLPASADATAPAIRICAPETDAEPAHLAAARAVSIFEEFSKLLGPAHLSEFTVLPGFSGNNHYQAGFSGPGFLVMDEDDLKYFGREGYGPNFLPHEIAHQWFPQRVAHASEEDGWLAESLGEYLAWRYLDAQQPGDARRMVTRAMRDALAADRLQPISLGLKLFALGNTLTQQTLYDRGMLVWRTLETVIDRERVDRALREYLERYSGQTASIVDFRKICEEISGRDLGWFFSYYISGTEIPEITLRREASVVPGEVSGEILVSGVPAGFTARVEMRISTPAGLVASSVATRGPATPFTVMVSAPASHIELDPDMRILRWTEAARRNRGQSPLLAQAYHAVHDDEYEQTEDFLRQALRVDPENLAGNEQEIRFQLGQVMFRMKRYDEALKELGRVLELASLDTRTTDAYYAWAHVYRARIAFARSNAAGVRSEAAAGLAVDSPVLEVEILPGSKYSSPTTAGKELRWLLASPEPSPAQHR